MRKPFLTVVTRCCKRPKMLAKNITSVLAQLDRDIEQVFLLDEAGVGVPEANKVFARHVDRIRGEYVYILDDDTFLLDSRFCRLLRRETAHGDADVVMVKSRRPQLAPHVLPKADVWGKPERMRVASTNCLCYAVRASWWKEHVEAFGSPAAGDWAFLKRLRDRGAKFRWLDRTVAETQQLGRGRLFEKVVPGWFGEFARKHALVDWGGGDWRLAVWALPRTKATRPAPKAPPRRKPAAKRVVRPAAKRAKKKAKPHGKSSGLFIG